MTAILTWVRAVILMPTTAISSITRMTAVLIRILGQVLVELLLKTARTDGERITTPETAPTRLPAIISQPVRKPR
jgi:hypothetical protein